MKESSDEEEGNSRFPGNNSVNMSDPEHDDLLKGFTQRAHSEYMLLNPY